MCLCRIKTDDEQNTTIETHHLNKTHTHNKKKFSFLALSLPHAVTLSKLFLPLSIMYHQVLRQEFPFQEPFPFPHFPFLRTIDLIFTRGKSLSQLLSLQASKVPGCRDTPGRVLISPSCHQGLAEADSGLPVTMRPGVGAEAKWGWATGPVSVSSVPSDCSDQRPVRWPLTPGWHNTELTSDNVRTIMEPWVEPDTVLWNSS